MALSKHGLDMESAAFVPAREGTYGFGGGLVKANASTLNDALNQSLNNNNVLDGNTVCRGSWPPSSNGLDASRPSGGRGEPTGLPPPSRSAT